MFILILFKGFLKLLVSVVSNPIHLEELADCRSLVLVAIQACSYELFGFVADVTPVFMLCVFERNLFVLDVVVYLLWISRLKWRTA